MLIEELAELKEKKKKKTKETNPFHCRPVVANKTNYQYRSCFYSDC